MEEGELSEELNDRPDSILSYGAPKAPSQVPGKRNA